VKFHGNSVSVTNDGRVHIMIGDEEYILNKPAPNILIKNVILGTKTVVWVGNVELECPQNGYYVTAELSDQRGKNMVSGKIFGPDSKDVPIILLEGETGKQSYYYHCEGGKRKKKDKKNLLIDCSDLPLNVPRYPVMEQQHERASMKIWAKTAQCIIDNDMVHADEEKNKVEATQRQLTEEARQAGKKYEPVYFTFDEKNGIWNTKDPDWFASFEKTIAMLERKGDKEQNNPETGEEGAKRKKSKRGKKRGEEKEQDAEVISDGEKEQDAEKKQDEAKEQDEAQEQDAEKKLDAEQKLNAEKKRDEAKEQDGEKVSD